MAVRIDPPRQLGITGDKSDYIIGYLTSLIKQLTFELNESNRRIEALEKRIASETSAMERGT